MPESTINKGAMGVAHFVIAGDKFGNVIAYDPVKNTDVVPLLSTGKII